MSTPQQHPQSRARVLYSLAAAASLVVAVIFGTIGDGVDVPEATGLRAIIVDVGHTAVWVLLTIAFAVAAVRGSWVRAAGAIAVAAGVLYALFLVAVFLWR